MQRKEIEREEEKKIKRKRRGDLACVAKNVTLCMAVSRFIQICFGYHGTNTKRKEPKYDEFEIAKIFLTSFLFEILVRVNWYFFSVTPQNLCVQMSCF